MPYNEGGIWYVHNSELSTFKRCRLKHKYAYGMNLVPIQKSRPLYLGSIFHAGLQYHYLNQSAEKAMQLAVDEDIAQVFETGKLRGFAFDIYMNEALTRLDLCNKVMAAYKEFDKKFPLLRGGSIPLLDGQPMVERSLEVPIEGMYYKGDPIMYRFTLDLAYEENSTGIWISDHKTGKQFLDVRRLELDSQLSLYIWALRQLTTKKVHGMEYNMIRMVEPKKPALVDKGKRLSVAAIDTSWENYRNTVLEHGFDPADYEEMRLKLADKKFFDRRSRVRTDRELAVVETELRATVKDMTSPDCHIYRNPTDDCVWDCPYRQICLMEFHGYPAEDVTQYIEDNFSIGQNRRESNDHIGAVIDKV